MKRVILNTFKLVVPAFMAITVSCQELEGDSAGTKDTVEPQFPDKTVNHEVVPGEALELTFTPVLDWELSVSDGDYQNFKLLDQNGRQRKAISGKASDQEVTVKIWVTPLEEYNNNRSCTLTMTMGGESQVVAEYMIPAKKRSLSVYAVKVQADTLVKDDTGAYVYETEEAESINVIWSPSDAQFLMPVRIESNCQWDIDRTIFPDWLELKVPENTVGINELVFRGSSLDDVSKQVVFKSADQVLKQINVSLPSCRGIDVYSALYDIDDWVYADEGYKYSEEAQENLTMIWTGNDFRLPVKVDSKCEWTVTYPKWMTVSLDERRAGIDIFNLMADPTKYPLDDTEGEIAFSYKDEVIHKVGIVIPGCRNLINYSMTMALTSLEFNYSGQYKTTAGYVDAPVTGHVTAPNTMCMKAVEIIDGGYSDTAPSWLDFKLEIDEDTDTRNVIQTKSLEVSVTENMTTSDRTAMIFFLPSDVESNAALFEEDGCTVKADYASYVLPVSQACVPADYLTPEMTPEDMADDGAVLIKSTKEELYTCFGQTRYAYELTYKNIWSSDGGKMYLTYPYASIEYYNAQKELVTDSGSFWIQFVDYMDNKTYGAVTIPNVRKDENGNIVDIPVEPGTSYVVFKDEAGATLCVLEFTYAPEIPEEPEEPEVPEDPENNPYEVDASQYFADPKAAAEAGATLVQYVKVEIPADEETNRKKYLQALKTTFNMCNGAPLFRLTYTNADTSLQLNLKDMLANATKFTVNPWDAKDLVTVNGKTYMNDSSFSGGTPTIKMLDMSSVASKIAVIPVVILFHDGNDQDKIQLAIECVLDTAE